MKVLFILFVFLFVIVIAGVFLFKGDKDIVEESPSDLIVPTGIENTVTYGDDGYIPASLTISIGDTVIFQNMSLRSTWPASNAHPTHTLYPGSGIQKCGGGEAIFDACGVVPIGQEWKFIFTEQGTWRYHDHMRPSMQGIIIVE
ncbi:MAG: hypothetical protein KJI69_00135 [Patescibacteria group bacterium]|nr:hypothetical protein [Patescibacteria group bacterium]